MKFFSVEEVSFGYMRCWVGRGRGFVLMINAWNCLSCVGLIDLHDLSLP